MRHATKRSGEKIAYPKNFAPILTEQAAAAEFSAVILPFSTGQLAQATGRSKETAKCWKAGRAFPNGVSLMALVQQFPQIKSWHTSKTGGIDTPKSLSSTFADIERILNSNTADSRALRAWINQMAAEGSNVS